MPLPRLPAGVGRRVFLRRGGPGEVIQADPGSLRYHFTPSAAGFQHKRGFCAECGSRITGGENAEGTSPIVGTNAGSLDDARWFRPRYNIFTADAQPWDYMDSALPKFEGYSTQTK